MSGAAGASRQGWHAAYNAEGAPQGAPLCKWDRSSNTQPRLRALHQPVSGAIRLPRVPPKTGYLRHPCGLAAWVYQNNTSQIEQLAPVRG
ncbi:hypothetical protein LMG23994_01017 [Cupriavidus pinatubonensis]|uniref:Uncharacterized protein n=1 Tax=Cupriavidus pinatubonensis TaxID=248026 RepID=A0ABM8WHI2_9BURK|nr:hypothetical protein LMG23994_01017 [Cupriavidus pinatubonensis]